MTTNIKELPIPFQTEMVKAVLSDRKTQTRRTRGLDRINDPEYFKDVSLMKMGFDVDGNYGLMIYRNEDVHNYTFMKSPYGKTGDLLWVRETFLKREPSGFFGPFGYKADFKHARINKLPKWKPSIYMPKAAARIWLMVEDVRVERLQDISKEDAKNEGIEPMADGWKNYRTDLIPDTNFCWPTTYHSFQSLWESINGSDNWDLNPWVWVVNYRVLTKTGRPSDFTIKESFNKITNSENHEKPQG